MFQTKAVEKIKTHILCSITFFRKLCRLWDNVEKKIKPTGHGWQYNRGRPQITIWRMRSAFWSPKATDTHTHTHTHVVFNTYRFSTATMVTRTLLNVTFIRTSFSYSYWPRYDGVSVGLHEDARATVVQEKLREAAPEVSLSCIEDIDVWLFYPSCVKSIYHTSLFHELFKYCHKIL
jgi:hypothetical protein